MTQILELVERNSPSCLNPGTGAIPNINTSVTASDTVGAAPAAPTTPVWILIAAGIFGAVTPFVYLYFTNKNKLMEMMKGGE